MTEIKTEEGHLIRVVSYGERIADLEKEKCELLGIIQGKDKAIKDLKKENAELKRDKEDLIFIRNQNAKCMCEDKENLAKAKEIIKEILEEDNYALLLPKEMRLKAEQFLNGEGCPDCFCEDCTKEDCGIKELGLVEVEK